MMNRFATYLLITVLAALLFFHSLGKVALFDWDEINFAESAREMIETGNYMQVQINYEPFWEKPPLFFWMQVASMKLFGVNEFAARLPNALCGVATLLILFGIGRRLHNEQFGLWWAFIYAGTFLPHLYFKSGIIDPWFNLFIFLGIYFLSRFLAAKEERKPFLQHLLFSGLFTGVAILTKGPVALLVVLLSYGVFILFNRWKGWVNIKYYLIWGLVVLLVTLVWFGLEIVEHGWWFVNEFITYQIRLFKTKDAGHGGFLLYHFVVVLIGCFPASLLIFRYRNQQHENKQQQIFRMLMIASLLVILVVFTIVKTKIVHYSSFTYLPIGYLAAATITGIIKRTATIKGWQKIALLVLGIIWSILFIALPLIGNNIHWLKPLLTKDAFAMANIEAQVSWNYFLMIPGILFLAAIITSFVWLQKKKFQKAFVLLLITCAGAMQVLLTSFAPRIEQYSQHAAIEFFESLQGKDVYIKTLGYKSYAQYFYTRIKPGQRKESKDESWLLTGQVDKPTYFISKNTYEPEVMKNYADKVEVIGRKNGFVFYKRK
ncbi:4-amino-4-deoxy-L-arabinose transferase-like glycosyltransferase [Lacibacter cauensis]|uniref:4-amino-4-deoxy-L-arabinose transferase-like glycosyltransferase n=1 Tax=Lacibacter cauensis TaxID=510947 RepID=A0A562SJR8_9BACT|nr:glycosyltransferase family 39 protein [Lacibacter cauensis]TWI81234.1 4-amino-4-deoxy-L-arabinose transferase-like glycosyltransferase [Lacibacter cauensis]